MFPLRFCIQPKLFGGLDNRSFTGVRTGHHFSTTEPPPLSPPSPPPSLSTTTTMEESNTDPHPHPHYMRYIQGRYNHYCVNGDFFHASKKILYNPRHFKVRTDGRLQSPQFSVLPRVCLFLRLFVRASTAHITTGRAETWRSAYGPFQTLPCDLELKLETIYLFI